MWKIDWRVFFWLLVLSGMFWSCVLVSQRHSPLKPTELNRPESPSIGEVPVDFSAYRPASGVIIRQDETRLHVRWPMTEGEQGVLVIQLRPNQPLIEELGISKAGNETATSLLRNIDPVTFLTVGTRDLSKQGWNVFFDNPPLRPHETYAAVLDKKRVRIQSQGRHSTIIIDGLSAGPFRGDLRFTVYSGCRLVHAEAVLSTEKDACAILYDAGLSSPKPHWNTVAWMDTNDQLQRLRAASQRAAIPVAARYRTIIAESDGGSLPALPGRTTAGQAVGDRPTPAQVKS